MEEIVALLLQVLIEFGVQLLGSLGFDVATSKKGKKDDQPDDENGCGWLIGFAVLGGVCGGLSLLVAPKLLLPGLGLRLLNLALAPLLAGGLSYLVARYVWAAGRRDPDHHFWRGFCFAFLFGLVRFAYAH